MRAVPIKPECVYDVHHRLKGRFRVRVAPVDGNWVAGRLIAGEVKHINPAQRMPEKAPILPGELVALNLSLCTLILVEAHDDGSQ